MKILKKVAFVLFSAILVCCMLTACNMAGNKLTVTYMVGETEYLEQTYESEDTVVLPTENPKKDGHSFVGWYKDQELTLPYTVGVITKSFTLYAKFSAANVYIIINANGGVKMDPVPVVPGGTYALDEAVKEGHTFVGYTYVDDNGDVQDFPMSGVFSGSASIRLTANYTINEYDVTFVGESEETVKVAYNSTVTAPVIEKAGHNLVGWYTSETFEEGTEFDFTKGVTEDVTLYAKYAPKSYTITVQNVQDGYGVVTATYLGTYSLPTPDKGANYEFQGFFRNGEPFAAEGTYIWTDNVTVEARWDGVGKDILFYDGDKQIARVDSEGGADIATLIFPSVPAKEGYTTDGKWYSDKACTTEFVKEGTLSVDIYLYAKYEPKTYTVTFMVYDEESRDEVMKPVSVVFGTVPNVPARADRDSYNFNGYYYFVDGEKVNFDETAAYMVAENIVVYEQWTVKADAQLFERHDEGALYFTEREEVDDAWTFVYLVGYEYVFTATSIELKTPGGDAFAVITNGANGNSTLKGLEAGEITVLVTKGNTSYERKLKIVESVNTFNVGTSYANSWTNRDANDWDADRLGLDENTNKPIASQMKVGRSNYVPDLAITNMNGEVLNVSQANIEVAVTSGDEVIQDYMVKDGGIYFGNTVADGTVLTVTIKPRYAIHTAHTASFTFTLNSGVNVYDNAGLKKEYGDANVAEINVLRNITAELSEDQYVYVPAGKTGTSGDYSYTVGGAFYAAKNSQPDGSTGTGVYERFDGDVKINGNYFTVDGSRLQLVDARSDEGGYVGSSNSYQAQNVQFGIFMFGHRYNTTARDNTVTMENLLLTGNFTGETFLSDHTIGSGVAVLKYSGACIGVHARNANVAMNNVTIRNCAFAANAYGNNSVDEGVALSNHAATLTATDCIFDRTWSNNIYVYGPCKVSLTSSYIGTACGAAIHFDARPNAGGAECTLVMDDETKIENWVVGEEAWFELYTAKPTVGLLKGDDPETSLKLAVEALSGAAVQYGMAANQRTIIKNENSAELVNFAILMKTVGDEDEWDAVGKPKMGVINAEFTCLDLIKYQGGDTMQMANAGTKYARAGFDASAMGFGYMEVFVGMINK